MDELASLLEGLDPAELEQLLNLGSLGDESSQVQGQIDALLQQRGQPGRRYETGWGAALGGIGDIARGIHSKIEEGDLRQQSKAIRDQQTAGRSMLVELLRRKRGVPPVGAPAAPMPMGSGGGMSTAPGGFGVPGPRYSKF